MLVTLGSCWTRYVVASLAPWHRMENRKAKWQKIGRKIEKGLRPEIGQKWPKNGLKMGFGVIFLFFRHFGAIFPISGHGPFSTFRPSFSYCRLSANFPFCAGRPDSRICWSHWEFGGQIFFSPPAPTPENTLLGVGGGGMKYLPQGVSKYTHPSPPKNSFWPKEGGWGEGRGIYNFSLERKVLGKHAVLKAKREEEEQQGCT